MTTTGTMFVDSTCNNCDAEGATTFRPLKKQKVEPPSRPSSPSDNVVAVLVSSARSEPTTDNDEEKYIYEFQFIKPDLK